MSKELLISKVAAGYDSYRPNGDTLAQIGQIDLVIVTGPTGVGKNTLIKATKLPHVLAETIREPRANNGIVERNGVEYEFRGNNLDAVYADYTEGNYVQIGMGPSQTSFYATIASNYPKQGPALIDLMASQVATMETLPFASVTPVHVTMSSYEAWRARIAHRGHLTRTEWASRRIEAINSITTALDDNQFMFILNDDLKTAADMLRKIATSKKPIKVNDLEARDFASNILLRLKDSQ